MRTRRNELGGDGGHVAKRTRRDVVRTRGRPQVVEKATKTTSEVEVVHALEDEGMRKGTMNAPGEAQAKMTFQEPEALTKVTELHSTEREVRSSL